MYNLYILKEANPRYDCVYINYNGIIKPLVFRKNGGFGFGSDLPNLSQLELITINDIKDFYHNIDDRYSECAIRFIYQLAVWEGLDL